MSAAASSITSDWELVLVNDGSPDNSLGLALTLQQEFCNIKIVDLARNFGHHAAIVAGLENTDGDLVFLLDCDLEEQPEWLSLFIEEYESTSLDVVYGVQDKRVANWYSNLFGQLYWKAINIAADVSIPVNPMTCRLMSRRYIDALLSVQDRVLYLAGVFAWTGFEQQPLKLTKTPRPAKYSSTYSVSKKLMHVVDSFSSFSVAPLILVFFSGVIIWLLSLGYAAYLVLFKIFSPETVLSGFTSLMLSVWFVGGATIMSLGITGLYIAKIFREVKPRPRYIIKSLYERPEIDSKPR